MRSNDQLGLFSLLDFGKFQQAPKIGSLKLAQSLDAVYSLQGVRILTTNIRHNRHLSAIIKHCEHSQLWLEFYPALQLQQKQT